MGRSELLKKQQKEYRNKNYDRHKEMTRVYMDTYLTKKWNNIDTEEMCFIWFRRIFK